MQSLDINVEVVETKVYQHIADIGIKRKCNGMIKTRLYHNDTHTVKTTLLY